MRKLIVVVALSVVSFATLQFSYADDFAFSEHLSGSIQIVDECSPNALERIDNPRPVVGSTIPNIVHQIWKTADVQEYSTEIAASRESWRAMLEPSNYTVKLWTDDDILELIKANYTWLLPTYNGYPHDIQRADLARLLIVHTEGGIYSDLDVYPRSAEHIQCLQTLGLQAIFSRTAGMLGLSNHFFMAKPGSPFLQWVLYEAKRRSSRLASRGIILPYLQVFWTTGPIMVTAAFRQYAWLYNTLQLDIGLLDDGFGGLVVRHAAGRSWQGADGRALNYIADHAGIGTMLRAVVYFVSVVGLIYMGTRCNSRFTRWMTR
ncbi:nucleotide-diphospho-sugar transferase [Aspergillus parasiticus]|uniref:Nucleotide-diphospho-sugar transferase n=1 Tax=Aspergillus parasiticus TaxID=5067 RepID=A0A5N6DKQ7_ASPPA|nr:nucleotide-diphospho-sugar transferase [Aspergillus parasiticus]